MCNRESIFQPGSRLSEISQVGIWGCEGFSLFTPLFPLNSVKNPTQLHMLALTPQGVCTSVAPQEHRKEPHLHGSLQQRGSVHQCLLQWAAVCAQVLAHSEMLWPPWLTAWLSPGHLATWPFPQRLQGPDRGMCEHAWDSQRGSLPAGTETSNKMKA